MSDETEHTSTATPWSRFAEQYYAWAKSQEFPKAPTRAEVQAELAVLRVQVKEDAKAWV